MRAGTRRFLVLVLCFLTTFVAAEELEFSITHPERAYGYTIGDVLEQTIGLYDGNVTHTVQTLPLSQREGRWVTRQEVELHPSGQQLTIRYQLVNTPTNTRLITLPALTLSTDQGTSIEVPTWSFSIAPLTPALPTEDNTLPTMQADWRPDLPSSSTQWRNIKVLCAALLALLLLWLVWWIIRGVREANTLPFANAYRTIRRHKTDANKNDTPQWLALHRAFDQVNGRRVSSSSIDELISCADWLPPFESDIRTFYATSSERFFATGDPHVTFDLKNLSKRLYKAEKRHTSKLDQPSLATHSMS